MARIAGTRSGAAAGDLTCGDGLSVKEITDKLKGGGDG
jgi:hypothetical protein